MKIWNGCGSEHSMNLVMIGRFKDAGDAASAKEVIDRLIEQVSADVDDGQMVIGPPLIRLRLECSIFSRRLGFTSWHRTNCSN